MPKFEGAVEMTASTNELVKEEKPVKESKEDSNELITKLLSNPETAALLKALTRQNFSLSF